MQPELQLRLDALLATLPQQWVAGLPLAVDEAGVVGRFFKCELRSRFVAADIGGATLTRAELEVQGPGGEPFPPAKLFTLAAGADGLLKLDRLCRLIHALNHFVVAGRSEPLLLSIHPRLFDYVKTAHGRTFARLLAHFELAPAQVVLELPSGLPQATIDGYLGEGFALRIAPAEAAAELAKA
ncbi:hypothetical protein [Chitinimonas koreensis]|uniref:hypothetical protein n=1 Tax=Chitinimonas koreensis TaxID=356302 RepID=UPI000413FF71|nr:hypothetical protein [Chitinimonas koreensis]QNM97342.1 hypothetical protein H9L41_03225 [Chitinimonas koreensis]